MYDLLIRNVDILQTGNGQVQIEPQQDIAIQGARIAAIHATRNSVEPAFEAKEVIEASGMLAIPGLMNTHAHVPMVLFRGMVEDITVTSWFNDHIWPLETNLTPDDVYWGALLGMAEMIDNGVTSVADHYFDMDEVAAAVELSGMRATLCWAVFAHEGEAKLDRTCEFVQRWQGKADGRITTWLGPHAPYTTTPDFLKLSARRAKELGTGIHIHVSETQDQVKLSLAQYGITPVQQLEETGIFEVPSILGHCRFPSPADLELMAKRNTGVAHAPKTYMKLGEVEVPLKQYQKAGVPLGLATDGAASSNTLDILEQLRMMVLAQKTAAQDPTYMTVAEALEIAFQGSARVLKQSDNLGAITAGRLADIVLLRQDSPHNLPHINPAANLIYSTNASDVDTVLCNGRVLKRGGSLLTIDMTEVKRQISKRIARLSERAPAGRRMATYPTI
jgi:5-methylthioadenosine/S-adenosylhomocysteine deaminase